MASKSYEADSIKALEGLDAVRKRPAMYIGDVGVRGLHHLIWEVVDNSIDEAMAGHATTIIVQLNGDGSVTVIDDGRGIPVGWHEQKQMSALQVVMTILHAGGKFDKDSYKVSGGLHGVGVSCVNALSEWLEAEVYKDGEIYVQRYERGAPATEVEKRGKCKRGNGTKVTFKPDVEIFTNCDTLEYNWETVLTRCRELAYLNKGIRIEVIDDRETQRKETFKYDRGITEYVEFLNRSKETIHKDVILIGGRDDATNTEVEIAMQYNDSYTEISMSFVNNINTHEGGTHLSGFRSALTRCINAWGKKNNIIKDDGLQGDDCREGLTVVVSARIAEPQFEGQTKTKLGNREVQSIVEAIVNDQLAVYFEEHPGNARNIINRAVMAAAARVAARKARDLARRKNALTSAGMPGKLADCISKDSSQTEIYLVEGDSAGGSAKVGRDNRTQAILPLRGKLLNVEKHRLDKVLEHNEISAIITALGTGIGAEEFDLQKLRYGKVVIMTDADVDGSHIRTLILTFFYRYMPDLITNGHVYIAQPPLFRVTRKKKIDYVLTEEDMNRSLIKLGVEGTRFEYRVKEKVQKALENGDYIKLLDAVQKIGRLKKVIERRGVLFKEYIEASKSLGVYPKYKGITKDGTRFFKDDEDLKTYIADQEKKGRYLVVEEDDMKEMIAPVEGEEKPARNEIKLELIEFTFAKELAEHFEVLKKSSFTADDYLPVPDPAEPERFFLINDGHEIAFKTLAELVECTCEMGKRGQEIQRYKGLGEMNPDQLWETTMDPARRSMLKVQVGNDGTADDLFTILMGDQVEPRRAFIEKFGPEVTDLDI